MEEEARKQYITHQQQHGHQGLVTELTGLWISSANPWLAASPDGLVHDPNSQPTTGLLEIKILIQQETSLCQQDVVLPECKR